METYEKNDFSKILGKRFDWYTQLHTFFDKRTFNNV